MDERRQHQRYDVKRPIKGSVKPRMEIRVVNISESGLLVEAPFGLPPAGICELTLNLPGGEMVIRGEGRAVSRQHGENSHGGRRGGFPRRALL